MFTSISCGAAFPAKAFTFIILWFYAFEFTYFFQSPFMSFFITELRSKKKVSQFQCKFMVNHSATKTNHIHIIIFNSLLRRKLFVNQAGSYSCYFICSNAGSNRSEEHTSELQS